MSAPPALKLSTRGYATIFVIVPPGKFRAEYKHVEKCLEQHPSRRPTGIVSEKPEVLYLLGQARFAARVEAVDYRDVLERAYPDRDSQALVSNAVFSIPYVLDAPKAWTHKRTDPGMIRFLTHLRVRRTVYAKDPERAESLIVAELSRISSALEGETTIEAGLGWADFIVSGVVHPSKFDKFLTLLVDFNGTMIKGDPECVFKRSLTLLGYAWTGNHQTPTIDLPLKALMFIRARPGQLAEVEKEVKKTFPGADVAFVDGKIDVIASMSGRLPDFFKGHEELSEKTGRHLIEKFETHVIFDHDLLTPGEESVSPALDDGRSGCRCVWVQHPHYELGEPGNEVLPPSLTSAIRNLDFLFSSTLRDHANCCDARTAVEACEESLKRLLYKDVGENILKRDAEQRHEEIGDAAALREDEAVEQRFRRIDRWVRTSERILRQRTVGSFEEFLGQSDRAVAYRGGAQKVLTVADNLMNDMYARLLGDEQPRSYLTSLYDSVDRIEHVVGTGLVRMPVRALFFLPGVIPDLWHEVGGFHFFRTLADRDVDLDLCDSLQRDLYYDLADHFGDLVSFLYGFRLDLEQFGTALIEGWLASQKYRKVPAFARRAAYVQIIVRIVAVAEFRDQQKQRIVGGPPEQLSEQASEERRKHLLQLYEQACGIASAYPSNDLPVSSKYIRESVIEVLEAVQLITGLEELRGRLDEGDIDEAIRSLGSSVDKEAFEFNSPAPLRSFSRDTDLNEEFRKLYWAVMNERRETGYAPNAFAQSAALVRGAALEYHRRAMPPAD